MNETKTEAIQVDTTGFNSEASLAGAAQSAAAESAEILNLLGDNNDPSAGSCCGGSCCA